MRFLQTLSDDYSEKLKNTRQHTDIIMMMSSEGMSSIHYFPQKYWSSIHPYSLLKEDSIPPQEEGQRKNKPSIVIQVESSSIQSSPKPLLRSHSSPALPKRLLEEQLKVPMTPTVGVKRKSVYSPGFTSPTLLKSPEWKKELDQETSEQVSFRKALEEQYDVNVKLITKDGFARSVKDFHDELKSVRKKYTKLNIEPYIPGGKYESPIPSPSSPANKESLVFYKRFKYYEESVRARNEEISKVQAERRKNRILVEAKEREEAERILQVKKEEEKRKRELEREKLRTMKTARSPREKLVEEEKNQVLIQYPKVFIPKNPKTPREIEEEKRLEFIEEYKRKKDFSFLKNLPKYIPPPVLFLRKDPAVNRPVPKTKAKQESSPTKSKGNVEPPVVLEPELEVVVGERKRLRWSDDLGICSQYELPDSEESDTFELAH